MSALNSSSPRKSAEKDFDPNATFTVTIEMPVVVKQQPMAVAIPEEKDAKVAEEVDEKIPQYMKDNIERMEIMKNGRTYMKNIAKDNLWVIGVRMALAGLIIAMYLYLFFVNN